MLKLEAQQTSAEASPPTSSTEPGYTVCVAAGARDFRFSSVQVTGGSATAVLTAFAWTTNIDVDGTGHAKLDTAQGVGVYHLTLHKSASGKWLVSGFDAAPASP
jgi:hypothetical protein